MMLNRPASLLAAFALALLALVPALRAVADPPVPAPAASTVPLIVHTKDFAYKPPTLTIPAGTTVTFINDDDTAHTITAVDQLNGKPIFDSGNMDQGQKWTHTFQTVGTFKYVCAYHPFMKATIVVTPPPTPAG
jgi:plastocyanin